MYLWKNEHEIIISHVTACQKATHILYVHECFKMTLTVTFQGHTNEVTSG